MANDVPQIPGYRVEREIGRGAMSVVYRSSREGNAFAIKIMKESDGHSVDAALRFRREAAALARLRHPGLVRVVDVGEVSGRPYFVMQLVEGEDLASIISRGPLPEERVVEIGKTLAGALAEVHRRGLVHRDVKPANVIIDRSGAARLIDFGFVAQTAGSAQRPEELVGTILYAAPEQTGMIRRGVDGRSDLYSLGAVLFECFTGRPVFQAETAVELIEQHATSRAPDVRSLRPEVRPVLAAIVAKLLAKDPDDRYQTAEALGGDLGNLTALEAAQRSGQPLVLGAGDVLGGPVHEVAFVGREAELAALKKVWTRVLHGTGAAILVEGEGGSGKTRLIRELTAEARKTALVLTCKCQQVEQVPLGPLREAVDSHVGQILRLPPAERETTAQQLRRAAGDFAPLLKQFSPGLQLVLKDVEESKLAPAASELFYDAVAELFTGLAREYGPTILVVDDVQWLDFGSTQVLTRLAERLRAVRLLLVGAARNDPASETARANLEQLLGGNLDTRIMLQPLPVEAVNRFISLHLGDQKLDHAFVERLAARAHGNPFAIAEYLRALLDSGAIRPAGGIWEVDEGRLSELSLPTDVLDLVISRVGTLSEAAIRALSHAALIGMVFGRGLLARVLGEDEERLSRMLQDAVQANLVERLDADTYSLVHDRVREALVARLPADKLRDVHQAIAEKMDGRDDSSPSYVFSLARHYAAGHSERNPRRTMEVSTRAGALALEAFANEDAYQFLSRAIELAQGAGEGAPVLAELEEMLGQACTRTARIQEAIQHFDKALARTRDSLVRARIHVNLSRVYLALWNWDGVSEQCQKALAELGQPFPRSELGRAASALWYRLALWVRQQLGELGYGSAEGEALPRTAMLAAIYAHWAFMAFTDARSRFTRQLMPRILHAVHFLGTRREAIEPLSYYAVVGAYAAPRLALHAGELAVGAAEQLGDRALLAASRVNLGLVYQFVGEKKKSEALDRETIQRQERWLLPRDFIKGANGFGLNLWSRGFAREAASVMSHGLRVADKSQLSSGMVNARATMAAAEALLGMNADAVRHCAEALEIKNKRVSPNDINTSAYLIQHMIFVHYEREDDGQIQEDIAAHNALGRGPEDFGDFARHYYVWVAYARLRQLMRAALADRSQALAAFKRTLADLERISDEPLKRSHQLILLAALEREEGHLRRASKRLREAEHETYEIDGQLCLYEIARERARIARRRGLSAVAHREARLALDLALQHGWKNRARWIRTEFGIEEYATLNIGESPSLSRMGGTPALPGMGIAERYMSALLEVSLASTSVLQPQEQARSVLGEIVRLLGADRAFLFLLDEATGELRLLAGRDSAKKELTEAKGYSTTAVQRVKDSRKPLVVTGTEEGALLGSESAVAHQLRSIMAAPLMMRERLVGVIYLDNHLVRGLFTADDVQILLALANHVAIAIETARAAHLEMERKALEMERKAMERDLELAAAVQTLFLPRETTYRRERVSISGFYRPAAQCGGDWWWYDGGKGRPLSVLVGDVTGHGAAPAMVTASVATSLRILRQRVQKPLEQALADLDGELKELCRGKYHMAVSALEVNVAAGTLRLWSAGAPPALLLRGNGAVDFLAPTGAPLGSGSFELGMIERPLEVGDRIFVFTDGLPDLELPGGRQLGLRRLSGLLAETRGVGIEESIKAIERGLDAARQRVAQADDLTFALVDVG